MQRGAVVIPRSSSPAHIRANANTYKDGALQLCLSEDDLLAVDALDGNVDREKPPQRSDAPGGNDPVAATFANLGDEPVHLFWRDPNGADVKVGLLRQNEHLQIQTYPGHEFVAKLERHQEQQAPNVGTFRVAQNGAKAQSFNIADPETKDL